MHLKTIQNKWFKTYIWILFKWKTSNELQNIILGDEQTGSDSQLKKAPNFLRGNEEANISAEKQQRFKDEETTALIAFAKRGNLFYGNPIPINDFISEGAEQKVYRFDDTHVLKTNQSIFYESWLDYFKAFNS